MLYKLRPYSFDSCYRGKIIHFPRFNKNHNLSSIFLAISSTVVRSRVSYFQWRAQALYLKIENRMTSKSSPSELSTAAPGIRSTGVHLGLVPLHLSISQFLWLCVDFLRKRQENCNLIDFDFIHVQNFRSRWCACDPMSSLNSRSNSSLWFWTNFDLRLNSSDTVNRIEARFLSWGCRLSKLISFECYRFLNNTYWFCVDFLFK